MEASLNAWESVAHKTRRVNCTMAKTAIVPCQYSYQHRRSSIPHALTDQLDNAETIAANPPPLPSQREQSEGCKQKQDHRRSNGKEVLLKREGEIKTVTTSLDHRPEGAVRGRQTKYRRVVHSNGILDIKQWACRSPIVE